MNPTSVIAALTFSTLAMLVGCTSPPASTLDDSRDSDSKSDDDDKPASTKSSTQQEDLKEDPNACRVDADCKSKDRICENKACTTGCRNDSACATGQTCTNLACRDTPKDACKRDADCKMGTICESAACVDGCRTKDDCTTGQVCSSRSKCVEDTSGGDNVDPPKEDEKGRIGSSCKSDADCTSSLLHQCQKILIIGVCI